MSHTQVANTVADFVNLLTLKTDGISFEQVMAVINQHYHYSPTAFNNGNLLNEAGTNEGSCKIFYFAHLNKLTEQQTLACFGHYYREDVLNNPQGNDHSNIRNFMESGWDKIKFHAIALTELT